MPSPPAQHAAPAPLRGQRPGCNRGSGWALRPLKVSGSPSTRKRPPAFASLLGGGGFPGAFPAALSSAACAQAGAERRGGAGLGDSRRGWGWRSGAWPAAAAAAAAAAAWLALPLPRAAIQLRVRARRRPSLPSSGAGAAAAMSRPRRRAEPGEWGLPCAPRHAALRPAAPRALGPPCRQGASPVRPPCCCGKGPLRAPVLPLPRERPPRKGARSSPLRRARPLFLPEARPRFGSLPGSRARTKAGLRGCDRGAGSSGERGPVSAWSLWGAQVDCAWTRRCAAATALFPAAAAFSPPQAASSLSLSLLLFLQLFDAQDLYRGENFPQVLSTLAAINKATEGERWTPITAYFPAGSPPPPASVFAKFGLPNGSFSLTSIPLQSLFAQIV